MTAFPEDLFQQLYNRAPTDGDRQRLLSARSALGLSSRDEFWPIIMVLDHYERTIAAGRSASLKEIKGLLVELKTIPERAGTIANAEAKKAIRQLIADASDKIARASAEKSVTTTDRMSKRQLILTAIAGGVIAASIAAGSAVGVYMLIHARGICTESPFQIQDGTVICVVDTRSG